MLGTAVRYGITRQESGLSVKKTGKNYPDDLKADCVGVDLRITQGSKTKSLRELSFLLTKVLWIKTLNGGRSTFLYGIPCTRSFEIS